MIQKNVFDEVSCTEANKPKLGLNFKRVQFLAQTNKAVNMLSYFEQPRRSLHVFLSSQNESELFLWNEKASMNILDFVCLLV